ncbi:uncharacterized protein LOC134830483 [Culicoides brevitarsis]|uniref:uncharacterized protein LOC134830483 n=1 Tax=Culicoides brevitarsis TaxID=469753 RepID=UPI00307B3E99
MENYNQMMNNEYNNMVYQSQMPVAEQPQPPEQIPELLPEHEKVATNEVFEQEQPPPPTQAYEPASNLEAQEELLAQNHQEQLQQEPAAETFPEENAPAEPMDATDAPNTTEEVVPNEVAEQQQEETVVNQETAAAENTEQDTETKTEENETEPVKEEVEESQEPVEGTSEPPKPKEPKIDPEQCRACTSRDNLQNIFDFKGQQMIANLVKIICPQMRISATDSLPNKICASCVEKVYAAWEFKQVAEQTDKNFRACLRRGVNKRRNAGDYILLDAKVALLSSSEDDEDAMMQDDDEFRVSKSEVSESESVSSVDSDFKPKKKYYKKVKKSKPGRKKKKAPPAPPAPGKRKVGRPPTKSLATTAKPTPKKSYKSNVVYIEADDDDDSDGAPLKKKKKRATGVAAERSTLPCPHCDKVFGNSHALREHLKSHAVEKFVCKLCDKQFKLKVSLDAHMQRHREEKEKSESASKAKVKVVKVPSPVVRKVAPAPTPKTVTVSSTKKKESEPSTGKDLFKTCAPLTSTYWSDSFSD